MICHAAYGVADQEARAFRPAPGTIERTPGLALRLELSRRAAQQNQIQEFFPAELSDAEGFGFVRCAPSERRAQRGWGNGGRGMRPDWRCPAARRCDLAKRTHLSPAPRDARMRFDGANPKEIQ